MDRLNGFLQRITAAGSALRMDPGQAWPLGATVTDAGVNFAVFSANASAVDLCLFDAAGTEELARLPLPSRTGDIWHGRLADATAGLVYGLRAHGSWRPDRGHRFNPNKLLLDPWAREIVGRFDWQGPHFGADLDHPQHMDLRDNGALALKARVVADDFDWGDDKPPHHAAEDLVLYEVHVRGFSKLLRGVPEGERGSYAALASDAAVSHLQSLGVNAVSLLPVQQILDEQRLAAAGLRNHWGYNTIGYFCPEPRYACGADGRAQRDEFRQMVRRLHAAGIEVILDVVYNHTAEGDERGPTLSWRGLDNQSWYRLPPHSRGHYDNYSGCGNTLDVRHPRVLQFVMDSLRYWVGEMHIDGFRFDLAPVLGRGTHGFERDGPFFKAVAQDPLLAGVRLIAEPWDLGPGGYQAGNFPDGWYEWNDRFRDTVRAFWLGSDCTRGEFAQRLCGSSEVFQPRRRLPSESVNYVVSHDGFTLADLVSYDLRHNEANLEDNRDGHGHNLSWNCGWEGPTGDPKVIALRSRLQRALLATVLLAQGTPMLAAGDELGHTQQGNNNPYCQDNALTWIDWSRADSALVDYTARVLALRRRWLPLANRWYTGLADARGRHDLTWLRRTGEALTDDDWRSRMSRVLGALIGAPGRADGSLLLMVNAHDFDTPFKLPPGDWQVLLDSAEPDGRNPWRREGESHFLLRARCLVLLTDAAGPPTA